MGFGYNKYALVLAALAAAGTVGCGGGGSSGGSASTVAPSTSGSSAAPTTSSTSAGVGTLAVGPLLQSVAFQDADGNQMITKGDKVTLTFDRELDAAAVASSNALDVTKEFELAVAGDSFGAGAKVTAGIVPHECIVVLGDRPILHVSDAFAVGKTAAGAASGLNVSVLASGNLKGKDAGPVTAAAQALDIGGTIQSGFRPAGSLAVARGAHAAVELDDGRVLIVGGIGAGQTAAGLVSEPELYDPITGTFSKVSDLSGEKGKLMNGRVAVKAVKATAIKLQDGKVLVCGGYGVEKRGLFGLGSEKVDTLDSAFVFDPATNTFEKVADMNWSRHSHTATLMSDGKVLIAGGYNDSFWSSDKTQAPFELYNPATKKFERAGSIFSRFKSKEPRMYHTATSIEGGSGILLAGGAYYSGGGLFGLVKPKLKMTVGSEVVRGLDTAKTGDLAAPRLSHAAASVSPRNVLIAGGHNLSTGTVGELELYDTATSQWTAVGSLKQARSNPRISVDGTTALIVGGHDGTAESNLAEVFNADSKTLEATTFQMATARNSFTVTTLKDGRVLVVGGLAGSTKSYESLDGQAIAECELFVRQ